MSVEAGAGTTRHIAEANPRVPMRLPFGNTEDFDDAWWGWLGSLSDGVIRATDGRVVWDAGRPAVL